MRWLLLESTCNDRWERVTRPATGSIRRTDIAQFFLKRHHHILSLDQLKIGSGFFECEAVNKQLLLDCSQAHITVKKISKLNETFTDQHGQQILPSIRFRFEEIVEQMLRWLESTFRAVLYRKDSSF